ncbi:MAG: DNA-binding protein WhiA [Clostridia bacterium]|nr:DNA-binding protein WhiA [Clostridia bacterium]
MSFTSDVKKEIIALGLGGQGKGTVAANKAGLSAFVQTSGEVGFKDGKPTFFLVSETENVAEFFTATFMETFGTELSITHATMDRMSGRDKLVLQCAPTRAETVLKELGLIKRSGKDFREGISAVLVNDETKKIGYIRGAFLGGGSCTLPKETGQTGYHLEIVFAKKKAAMDFCDLLSEFELIVKLIERKDTYVVYLKSKEAISDFLAVVGAQNALKKFSAFSKKRDEANRSNRAQNCMAGNADKTTIAAVKQVVAIRKLVKKKSFEDLSEELKTLARFRLENPTMSLQELADSLKISKSCLSHRMRRLIELSETTKEKKEKGKRRL